MSLSWVVLVLASGRGERFAASGGSGPKLQALLAGRPLLDWTLAAVHASGLPCHLEDAGHPGMGGTIAAAVRATAGASGWLILPADLPLIQASTLRAVAQAPDDLEVVTPVFRGQRGHPVRFSAACGPELMRLTGCLGAASVLRARHVTPWPVDDEGCVADVDTLDDLQRLERLVLSRAGAGPA